jgi:hypothetical protein
MKRLMLVFAMVAFLVPAALAEGTPKSCYQNYTAIRCGEQAYFEHAKYCADINLTIDDCYNEGGNFTAIFSGIRYFKIPDEFSRVTFFFYSRSWSWLGDEKDIPLPEGSQIYQIDDTHFKVVSPLGENKIESVQITVPFCYNQINRDNEKIYPRTQAGRICRMVKTAAGEEEAAPITQSQDSGVEKTITTTTTTIKQKDNSWILAILLVVVVIIGIIVILRKPKKKKKR